MRLQAQTGEVPTKGLQELAQIKCYGDVPGQSHNRRPAEWSNSNARIPDHDNGLEQMNNQRALAAKHNLIHEGINEQVGITPNLS